VVVETEVVEVEKSLGAVYGTSIGQFFLGDDLRLELLVVTAKSHQMFWGR
jgi:hypothetical protein